MVFRKKPVATNTRRPRRRAPRKKSTAMTASKVRSIALKAVEKTREIKRLWGKIKSENSDNNNVAIPTGTNVPGFLFSDGTNQYETSNLVLTHQGLENENRIGNVIQPLRFNLKGYGFIESTLDNNFSPGEMMTHVRVVCGFRRQASILTPSQGNLMMEGGVEGPLNFNYTDIINGFNWKEFRPFYDKVYKVCPTKRSTDNYTQPFVKNYFHFDIKHKFGPQEQLVSLEDDAGLTTNMYNNKNVYVMFIARQMNNDNDVVSDKPLEIYATSLFQFHDA